MELQDTIEMMTSADYNERFKAEFLQLQIRIDKLERMLKGYREGTLNFKPKCSYELLHKQLVFMKAYMEALNVRADIEHIEL